METLKEFDVQAWFLDPDSGKRNPGRRIKLKSTTGLLAAKVYARMHQIPDKFWFNVGPKPPIVIRVA